ncbi:unnamed protein product [Lactuca virosa]|uniref:Uncharacterized protein n=1 Tax=Lactuca virosa TaxID=75947 RepID=A0AAU9MXB3_9ASTR|nr:unnamed protein product [Lactuca virosa]
METSTLGYVNTLLDRESYNNTWTREIDMMHQLIISNRGHQVPSPLPVVNRVVVALCRRRYYRASLSHQIPIIPFPQRRHRRAFNDRSDSTL